MASTAAELNHDAGSTRTLLLALDKGVCQVQGPLPALPPSLAVPSGQTLGLKSSCPLPPGPGKINGTIWSSCMAGWTSSHSESHGGLAGGTLTRGPGSHTCRALAPGSLRVAGLRGGLLPRGLASCEACPADGLGLASLTRQNEEPWGLIDLGKGWPSSSLLQSHLGGQRAARGIWWLRTTHLSGCGMRIGQQQPTSNKTRSVRKRRRRCPARRTVTQASEPRFPDPPSWG